MAKMKILFEGWRKFLTEEELFESRLGDLKKKLTWWAKPKEEYGGVSLLDKLAEADPSNNNKYLNWMAKRLIDAQHDHLAGLDDVEKIGKAVQGFDRNRQRLQKKDINQYKTIDELTDAVEQLGISNRQQKLHKKQQAMEGSEIVIDEPDIFVVRPFTEDASCFYGKHTRWCISAEKSENYFNRYSKDGMAFYFMKLNNLSSDNKYAKIALVYDRDHDLSEMYDATDYQIKSSEVLEAIHKNNGLPTKSNKAGEIWAEIREAVEEHLSDNPVDTSEFGPSEEEFEEIKDEFNANHSNVFMELSWDDDGDTPYMRGYGDLELDVELVDWRELGYKTEWAAMGKIRDIVNKALYDNSVYPDILEIDDSIDGFRITMDFSYEGYENGLEAAQEFAQELDGIDNNLDDSNLIPNIITALMEADFVASDDYYKAYKEADITDFKNIELNLSDPNELDVLIDFPINAAGVIKPDSLKELLNSQRLKDEISGIIQEFFKEASSQLNLPLQEDMSGLPAAQVYDLTVANDGVVSITYLFRFTRTNANAANILKILKVIDNNYEGIYRAYVNKVQKFVSEFLRKYSK